MHRIGVIGAGPWGINHVRVLATELRCSVVKVADPDAAVHERVRAIHPSITCTRDPDDVIGDPTIEAVIVATPAPTHAQLACAAMHAGKHVLVEKPLALDLASALRVLEAQKTSGRIAMVGHLMVYHPAIHRLRMLVDSGELGRVHYIHSSRVNLGRIRREENALWSFAPHDLSMLDFLLRRQPQSVSARGQCITNPDVEDVVFVTLRYASGEMANLQLSRISPHKERRLTVVGSLKMAEFDDVSHDKLRIFDKAYDRPPDFTHFAEYLTIRDGDVRIPQIVMEEPLRLEIQHFLDCIEHRSTPLSDVASGVRVVSILAAAQRSLTLDGASVEPDNMA